MADEDLSQYTRGQLSIGGVLRKATGAEFTFANGAKLVSTLVEDPSGIVIGKRSIAYSAEIVVPKEGPERDYYAMVQSGRPQQARFILPGGVRSIVGTLNEVTTKATLEDGVQMSIKGIGKLVRS